MNARTKGNPMAMGIVSDEVFEKELLKIVEKKIPGRGNGNNAIPESLRKLIGENAIEEGSGTTKELTRALGISDSSLSAYKVGATSTVSYHNPDKELLSHVDKARERIVKKARNRLVQSLNHITDEKLADEKPRDLAGIAKDMSVIIKNFEPAHEEGKRAQSLIIFAPQFMEKDNFEVIDVQVEEEGG
jgi:hypothetical protein